MSCGTCHVYVAAAWLDKLPAKSQDEADMIEALADFVELRPSSRLSCQLPVDASVDGLEVEIAPQVFARRRSVAEAARQLRHDFRCRTRAGGVPHDDRPAETPVGEA